LFDSASFEPLCVKVRLYARLRKYNEVRKRYISPICPEVPLEWIVTKLNVGFSHGLNQICQFFAIDLSILILWVSKFDPSHWLQVSLISQFCATVLPVMISWYYTESSPSSSTTDYFLFGEHCWKSLKELNSCKLMTECQMGKLAFTVFALDWCDFFSSKRHS